ncbi:myb family DNA-binding domain-containing protein [Cyclospora cayetanensis]|uniref:Myb family DNA-binding domain-containing protein n=1 Tax=Cyclospora cayetanensis TaxID=88456 RepID=A0A1D3D5T3_9EIME|nr:myb family DNA-binding domain-containing protein [Cyclospora cayetanensis]
MSVRLISVMLGTPTPEEWNGLEQLPGYSAFDFSQKRPGALRKVFSSQTPACTDLLSRLLALDPAKRITARDGGCVARCGLQLSPTPTSPRLQHRVAFASCRLQQSQFIKPRLRGTVAAKSTPLLPLRLPHQMLQVGGLLVLLVTLSPCTLLRARLPLLILGEAATIAAEAAQCRRGRLQSFQCTSENARGYSRYNALAKAPYSEVAEGGGALAALSPLRKKGAQQRQPKRQEALKLLERRLISVEGRPFPGAPILGKGTHCRGEVSHYEVSSVLSWNCVSCDSEPRRGEAEGGMAAGGFYKSGNEASAECGGCYGADHLPWPERNHRFPDVCASSPVVLLLLLSKQQQPSPHSPENGANVQYNPGKKNGASSALAPIPSLPVAFRVPSGSSARKSNRSGCISKWRLCAFQNKARGSEGLRLVRWQRVTDAQLQQLRKQQEELRLQGEERLQQMEVNDRLKYFQVDEDAEFVYAKFHIKIQHPPLTQSIYDEAIKGLDASWSYAETRELWNLCESFDLRWAVILDRFSQSGNRSMEDLKSRYFAVARQLTLRVFDERIAKAQAEGAPSSAVQRLKEERGRHPLVRFSYKLKSKQRSAPKRERSSGGFSGNSRFLPKIL